MKRKIQSDSPPEDSHNGIASTVKSGTRMKFEEPIILVVDDNADNRDLFGMVLERYGRVVMACDGKEGIDRAKELRPVIIFMDLTMPNVDGFEATERIRAIPELATVPIYAVTACTDAMSLRRAIGAGCNEVLLKPCSSEDLTSRTSIAIDAARSERARRIGAEAG